MALEIRVPHPNAGKNLYAIVFNRANQIWDTVSLGFVTFSSSTWANLDIALTEQQGYQYFGTFPPTIPAGFYTVIVYERLGGSPANTDYIVHEERVYWNGSNLVPTYAIDDFLKYDLTQVSSPPRRSPMSALRRLCNRVGRQGSTGSIYEEDDSTVAYTVSVETDPTALPVVSIT